MRITLSVANRTQKPFSTSSSPPSSRARDSPTASRRLFWSTTERGLSVEDTIVTRRSSMALHPPVEPLAHRAGARREAVGADHDAGVGDDAADRGGDLAREHRAVGADRERVGGSPSGELLTSAASVRSRCARPASSGTLHGRRRALAAQRRGGRLERLAQLPRQGPLGVGDAAYRRRALRQPLEQSCARLRP